MKLKATKKGDKYILNGNKMWISNGPCADVIIVYARADNFDKKNSIVAFIVETKFKGFSAHKIYDKMGMRGLETAKLLFEDCEVPEANVLGGTHKGTYVLMRGIDYERLLLAAGALGIMQKAFDISLEYAN